MKNKQIAFCIALIALISIGITCLADAPSSDYKLMFRDDFNGTTLNTDLWSVRSGNPYGGKNLAENVRITDGKLYLDYTKTDGYYSGGGILTNMPLPYGYYETKSKVYTGANGFHTSFWLCGGDAFSTKPAYFPYGNQILELDGYEIDSNESTTTAPSPGYNNHFWWGDHKAFDSGAFSVETDNNPATLDEFTMGIEWLPGKVIYYANGVEVGRSEKLTVYGPSYLWLTAVAVPEWQTSIDDSKMDENGYFGSSTYEYASYSQKKLKGVNLLGNGHFEYNRTVLSEKPRAFDSEKTSVIASVNTYDGLCCAQVSAGGKLEQQLPYLLAGKYGFEGYFRAKPGTVANVYIRDKHGNVLYTEPIPVETNWTKISIPDIAVSDSAFISVECSRGVLMADNLSFYCQEGDDTYIHYKDDDYENYALYKNIAGTEHSAAQSVRSGTWSLSTLNGVENYWIQVYNPGDNLRPLYTDTYAKWDIPITREGAYTIELYRMQYKNNVQTQDYTILIDGIPADIITVQTNNTTPNYDWITLKTLQVKSGQTLTVKMTPCAPKNDAVCARISPIRIANQEQTVLKNSFVTKLDSAAYFDHAVPGIFDAENIAVAPYAEGETLYLPRLALEEAFNVKFPGNTEYVSAQTVENTTNTTVTLYSDFIFIHNGEYLINDACVHAVLPFFYKIAADPFIHTDSDAKFFGTANITNQELFNYDTANLVGAWGKSGLGYNSESRYTNQKDDYGTWTLSPKATKRYSVQFYSVVHNGASNNTPSTKNAQVILHVPGKGTHTYNLDQCDGQNGWYHLAHMDLTPDDTIYIYLSNKETGTLRASAVRLVPSDTDAVFVGDFDEAVQEKYELNTAEIRGNWLPSGIGTNTYYADKNASAKWPITPSKTQKYAVQVYIPTTTTNNNTTQKALVQLTVNDSPYYFTFDECLDTTAHTGWYDMGLFDLTPTSQVEIQISDHTAGFLRAGAVRLVPYPNKPYATKSGTAVTLYAGTLSCYESNFLFAEYDSNGILVDVTKLSSAPKQTITLQNTGNTFKCFFWEEDGSLKPVTTVAE